MVVWCHVALSESVYMSNTTRFTSRFVAPSKIRERRRISCRDAHLHVTLGTRHRERLLMRGQRGSACNLKHAPWRQQWGLAHKEQVSAVGGDPAGHFR